MGQHTVAALVTHGVAPFELAVGAEVFGYERLQILDPWPYRFIVCSAVGPRVRMQMGVHLDGVRSLRALDRADTVIVPAWDGEDRPPEEMLTALQRAYRRGARIMSVCSGAFALAHAGLLDGKRATTHWMHADDLARRFPDVEVDKNVLYVDEGQVLTSAGTAAGIDLCLHVMRLDHGAEVANAVARRMVVPPHRDGGQAQYVDAPIETTSNGGDALAATLDWAVEHLDQPLTVETLAHHALMSPRTFARRFRATTGTTPLQWLLRQRLVAAQRMLEATDVPVEEIAEQCGFGSATVMRTHFRRMLGTSPHAYRRTFREAAS